MAQFMYDTFKENPPAGTWVFARIRMNDTGEEFEKLAQYREPSIDPRAYIDEYGESVGRVIAWRFMTKEEAEFYGK